MSKVINLQTDCLVEGFIYRGYSFDVTTNGYKNFIESRDLPKYKLVYVYLHDPLDQYKIIKEGFIIRTRWKKYKRLNIKLKYNGIIYHLQDFNPFIEYMTSLHNCYDYSKFL